MQGNWTSECLVEKQHRPNPEINFSHLTQQVKPTSPWISLWRQQRASPEQSLQPGPCLLRLPRFQDVFLAASRVHLRTETSQEQMDRCHFWTNSVHTCVSESKTARYGCALGSTLNPEKEGERSCLRQEGDAL